MTSTPETAAPARDAPSTTTDPSDERPALRVVDPGDASSSSFEACGEAASSPGEQPAAAEAAAGQSSAEQDEITPEAPWQYRLGKAFADMADAAPGLWSNRRSSFAERVEYSLNGDWTVADPGQGGTRIAHLVGTLLCLAVDGLVLTPLQACTDKPSRLFLLITALTILGYAL